MSGTGAARPAVAVFPGSDKLGVWPDGEQDTLFVRRDMSKTIADHG